jgi:hypothetical protein
MHQQHRLMRLQIGYIGRYCSSLSFQVLSIARIDGQWIVEHLSIGQVLESCLTLL